MNCPQCQEQLDERLDELRSGVRSGALSPGELRAQAQSALDEALRQCSECEADLRSHLAMRLSLMLPDEEMASIAVPPALRANVRRALEREAPSRSYAAYNPFKGFAWTGGAIMSAVLLFVVARPYLIERAQTPLSESATSASAPLPQSPTATNSASPAMPRLGQGGPIVNTKRAPSKTKEGPTTAPPPGKAAQQVSPSIAPVPESATIPGIVTPPKVASPPAPAPVRGFKPRARVEAVPSSQKPAGNSTGVKAPVGTGGQLSKPKPQMPMVGAAPPPVTGSTRTRSIPSGSAPSEPRLDNELLASSGKELGLNVRFVPDSSSRVGALESRATKSSPNVFAAPPSLQGEAPPPSAVEGPKPVAPAPMVRAAPPADAADSAESNSMPQRRAMRPQTPPGAGARGGNTPPPELNDSTNNREATASAQSATLEKGKLAVSVNEAVTNARVVGQVQGREGEGILLWAGNAIARKPISVPLAPLEAKKGDTIDIAFQQQISLGQTKTLATTSVVLP